MLSRRAIIGGISSLLATKPVIARRKHPQIGGGDEGGGGGSYVAKAVHFDGGTWLSTVSLASIDNSSWSFSFWFKGLNASDAPAVFVVDPRGGFLTNMQVAVLNYIALGAFSAAEAQRYQIATPTGLSFISWHHLLGSIETNFAAGLKRGKFYLDDVDVTTILADNDASFTMPSNSLPFFVGSDSFGDNLIGDISDLWIAPGQSLLSAGDIPESTRRLFIGTNGKPVNPSGFPSCPVLFSGDHSTFATNQGNGGAFSLTGTLTDATTSPSN